MKLHKILIGGLAPLVLAGCAGVGDGARAFYRQMDPKQMNLGLAETYQKELPSYLGLASERVRVQPAAENFAVIIYDVQTTGEQKRISLAVAGLNAQNPDLLPLSLQFR